MVGGSERGVHESATAALLQLDHPRKMAAATWAGDVLGEVIDRFDRDRWDAAAEFGIQGLTAPVELGGRGATTVDALLTFEGLGLGALDNGTVFALSAQVFSMQSALLGVGSDEQLRRWIPELCSGRAIGAFAMSEPEVGSDTSSITTRATPLDHGRFRLDGHKTWVTLGTECDVIIVFATTDPKLGRWGLTAFLIDTDRPGIERSEAIPKIGLKSCPFTSIAFDNCIVGADEILGASGAGAAIFADAVNAERAFLYAAQLGATERMIDAGVRRAQDRTQFGASIGSFQAVAHRIVEMKLRHEASRLLVYKTAMLNDLDEDVTMAASLAKLQTSESAVRSVVDAMQLFGAEGYTEAAGLGVELLDSVGGLSYSGTSDIQRNIVASMLGVDRPAREKRRPE